MDKIIGGLSFKNTSWSLPESLNIVSTMISGRTYYLINFSCKMSTNMKLMCIFDWKNSPSLIYIYSNSQKKENSSMDLIRILVKNICLFLVFNTHQKINHFKSPGKSSSIMKAGSHFLSSWRGMANCLLTEFFLNLIIKYMLFWRWNHVQISLMYFSWNYFYPSFHFKPYY